MDGSEIDGFQIRVDYSITDSAHKSVSCHKMVKELLCGFAQMIALQADSRSLFPPWQSNSSKYKRETRVQRQG